MEGIHDLRKPFLRRLARRGGAHRIMGLLYDDDKLAMSLAVVQSLEMLSIGEKVGRP